jgi:hypothetical protein
MWRQNQNNFKNLDELTNLPGETTADRAEMWQRLESRLQKKPQKKKVSWFWAAAGLLICITVPFLFNSNKDKIPKAAILNNTTTTKSPISKPNKAVVPENIKLNTTAIKLPPFVGNAPTLRNKIQRIKTKQDSFITNTPLPLDLIVQDNSSTEIDTLAKTLAITAKKKISVVHINDLEEEDRIAGQNSNLTKSLKKKRTKTADRFEYAGTLNFRIYFKN